MRMRPMDGGTRAMHGVGGTEFERSAVKMNMRRMGRTGLKVSEICLGTMTFGAQADEKTAHAIMDVAADAGINFIDTADMYPVPASPEAAGRTEEIIGKWLEKKRDDFVLATKCYNPMGPLPNDVGLSRRHMIKALDDSLRRLRTDYIDLYQIHRWDPQTPIAETLATFDDMRRSGKIRYAGCSNVTAWQLVQALGISEAHDWVRWDCLQPRFNLLHRSAEWELLPAAREFGVGVIAYNPLAGGFLSGKHKRGEPTKGTRFEVGGSAAMYRNRYWQDAMFDAVDKLKAHAEGRGRSLVGLAVRWVVDQPGITSAILGASKPEQLKETLAQYSTELDDADREHCDEAWYSLPRRRPEDER